MTAEIDKFTEDWKVFEQRLDSFMGQSVADMRELVKHLKPLEKKSFEIVKQGFEPMLETYCAIVRFRVWLVGQICDCESAREAIRANSVWDS